MVFNKTLIKLVVKKCIARKLFKEVARKLYLNLTHICVESV